MTVSPGAEPPFAAVDPPWSDCGDRSDPEFGALFASRGACGSTVLSFDRRGRFHAVTLYRGAELTEVMTLRGRRFHVVRVDR